MATNRITRYLNSPIESLATKPVEVTPIDAQSVEPIADDSQPPQAPPGFVYCQAPLPHGLDSQQFASLQQIYEIAYLEACRAAGRS